MDDGGRTQVPSVPAATPRREESLRIDLADATGRLSEPACGWLMERLSEALPEACRRESGRTGGQVRGGEVRVRIIADDEMAKMHEEYAGVPGTTDVLTFDMSPTESEHEHESGDGIGIGTGSSTGFSTGIGTGIGPGTDTGINAGVDSGIGTGREAERVPPLDVDLLVCLDEAQRQASARGHGATPQLELLLYALHGVLHCLGHDDHEESSFRAMHDAEDAILTAIGVGPVFARPEFKPAEGGGA